MKSYCTYTDEQLLLMLSGSDQQAFTELYNRYHTGIYNYQSAFIKIPSLAEDLTEELFMKIWEARHRLEIHTSFASYIYRVSRNVAIDSIKKIASDRELLNEVMLYMQSFFPESGISKLQEKEDQYLYKQAIDSLSRQRKTVYLLCKEEGKTYEEAARLLGISRHTVKEHMAESLRSLRHFLSEKAKTAMLFAILFRVF